MNTWLRREKHQGLSCTAFWQSFNKYFINMQMYVKYLVTSVMQSSNPSNRTVDQSSFHNVPPPTPPHTHILFKKEDDHISLLYWIIVNTHVQLYPPPPHQYNLLCRLTVSDPLIVHLTKPEEQFSSDQRCWQWTAEALPLVTNDPSIKFC